jgi:hypothetical protein
VAKEYKEGSSSNQTNYQSQERLVENPNIASRVILSWKN